MKKNNLLLVTGLSILLSGCAGIGYTNENYDKDNDRTIDEKESLFLTGEEKGEGKFWLISKVNNEYKDGYFSGFLGIGKVEGDVKYKETITRSGTWTQVDDDDDKMKLTVSKITISVSFSGDGAEDYKDIKELELLALYGEDDAQSLIAGDKVTIEYTDDKKPTYTIEVEDDNNTFEYKLI